MTSLSRWLTHLSPSSLNLWIANPRQWTWQYLVKERPGGGPAMWRGTAIETGLQALLRGKPMKVAQQFALENFALNAEQAKDFQEDALAGERDRISPTLAQLAKRSWTTLNAAQIKVEHYLDGTDIPTIGYVDFAFEDGDCDLKTTGKAVNKLSAMQGSHIRQVAIYRAARKKPGRLLYAWPNGTNEFVIDDNTRDAALHHMTMAAQSLARFLSKVDNADDALKSLPYDPDNYRSSPLVERGTAEGFEPIEMEKLSLDWWE